MQEKDSSVVIPPYTSGSRIDPFTLYQSIQYNGSVLRQSMSFSSNHLYGCILSCVLRKANSSITVSEGQ